MLTSAFPLAAEKCFEALEGTDGDDEAMVLPFPKNDRISFPAEADGADFDDDAEGDMASAVRGGTRYITSESRACLHARHP